MNSGRAGLAWMLTALFAGALLAVVVLGGLPERGRPAQSNSLAPTSNDTAALTSAIEKLDQRLARIEAALAVQDSRGTRGEVKPNPAASASTSGGSSSAADSTIAGADELHTDLLQISKRIDLLAGSLKEDRKPAFSIPTLEQVHAARRDIDWAFVEPLRALAATNPDAASERVRGMTFDDVLKKVGLPDMIDDEHGYWKDFRTQPNDLGQPTQTGVTFVFVGDTVSSVWRIN